MIVKNTNKQLITMLSDLFISLSKEFPTEIILEKTLSSLQSNTKADGATLYIKDGNTLRFHIIKNKTLNMDLNKSSTAIKNLPEISLSSTEDRQSSISAHCAITKKIINIEDISLESTVDIGPTKAFDEKFKYKTKSILATPILDGKQDVLGVIQLINAQNNEQLFTESDVQTSTEVTAMISAILSNGN